jgi:hypothetical protein
MTKEELESALQAVDAYLLYYNRQPGGANTLPQLRGIYKALYGKAMYVCSRTIVTVCNRMRHKITAMLDEA